MCTRRRARPPPFRALLRQRRLAVVMATSSLVRSARAPAITSVRSFPAGRRSGCRRPSVVSRRFVRNVGESGNLGSVRLVAPCDDGGAHGQNWTSEDPVVLTDDERATLGLGSPAAQRPAVGVALPDPWKNWPAPSPSGTTPGTTTPGRMSGTRPRTRSSNPWNPILPTNLRDGTPDIHVVDLGQGWAWRTGPARPASGGQPGDHRAGRSGVGAEEPTQRRGEIPGRSTRNVSQLLENSGSVPPIFAATRVWLDAGGIVGSGCFAWLTTCVPASFVFGW